MKKLKALNKLAKHKSDILMGAGLLAIAGGTFLACRATLKAEDAAEELADAKEKIEKAQNDEALPDSAYSEEDAKKDLAKAYGRAAGKMAKQYAPAVGAYVFGVVLVLRAYSLVKAELVSMTGAALAIETAFKAYRERVAERYGEDAERDIYLGAEDVEYEVTKTLKNGKEKTEKRKGKTVDPAKMGLYEFFYDDATFPYGWQDKGLEYNLYKLKQIEHWANDKLQAQGFLFLDDVLRELGMDAANAAEPLFRTAGWFRDGDGDGYVDFGVQSMRDYEFPNESVVVLNLNVDGLIGGQFANSGVNGVFPDKFHADVVEYAEAMQQLGEASK